MDFSIPSRFVAAFRRISISLSFGLFSIFARLLLGALLLDDGGVGPQRLATTTAGGRRRAAAAPLEDAALDDDDLSKYGPNLEFLALKDECFEKSFQGYKYSFCFFGNAKQDFNSLGNMNSLGEMEADGTMTVKFTDGARCWNGPARSLHVALQCGGENEMLDVYEPTVCEYHMKFTTPAVC